MFIKQDGLAHPPRDLRDRPSFTNASGRKPSGFAAADQIIVTPEERSYRLEIRLTATMHKNRIMYLSHV